MPVPTLTCESASSGWAERLKRLVLERWLPREVRSSRLAAEEFGVLVFVPTLTFIGEELVRVG